MKHSAVEMGFSAAEIVARRMPVIWWGMWKPTAASKAEMTRMVVEKQMAFAEACVAVQGEIAAHDACAIDARQRRSPGRGRHRTRGESA